MIKHLVLLSLFLFFSCAEEVAFESKYMNLLTDEQFKDLKEKKTSMIVLFFQHWCGHCRHFAPEYNKVAEELGKDNFPFKVCAVNMEKYTDSLKDENIEGYPTVKIFHNGNVQEYKGDRSLSAIYTELRRTLYGPILKIKTLNEIDDLKKKHDRILLTTIDPESQDDAKKKAYKEFELFALNNRANTFISCHSEECVQKYPNKVTYLRNFDEPVVTLGEELPVDNSSLSIFELFYKYPSGGNFSNEAAEDMFDKNRTTVFYFRSNDPKQAEKDEVFKKFCDYWRETFNGFIISDLKSPDINQAAADYYGIDDEDLPYILLSKPILENETVQNFAFPIDNLDKITFDNLHEWINDYLMGKLKPVPLTQSYPKEQETGTLRLVGKTFKKNVLDNDKNVIVFAINEEEITGRRYIDAFRAVTEKFQGSEKALLSAIDIVSNDVELIPEKKTAFYLFLKGKKDKPLVFEVKDKNKDSVDPYEVLNWLTDNLGMPRFEKEKEEGDEKANPVPDEDKIDKDEENDNKKEEDKKEEKKEDKKEEKKEDKKDDKADL